MNATQKTNEPQATTYEGYMITVFESWESMRQVHAAETLDSWNGFGHEGYLSQGRAVGAVKRAINKGGWKGTSEFVVYQSALGKCRWHWMFVR